MFVAVTGPPAAGKTTLVRRLAEDLDGFTGFYTEEVREGERRAGFQVVDLSGKKFWLARKEPGTPRVGRYRVYVETFERYCQELLERFDKCDRWLIDEVGKMELLSSSFCFLLSKLLEQPPPHLLLTFGKNIPAFWKERIAQRAMVVEVTRKNRNELYIKLRQMLKENA